MEGIYFTLDDLAKKYMDEINKILERKPEATIDNALEINKQMQKSLQMVREKLEALLEVINKRYKSNSERVRDGIALKKRGISYTGAYVQGRTFFYEGNMYFRDKDLRNCPNNEDYLRRKTIENEKFPMDWDLRARHIWTIKDKTNIVYGVKGQVVEHLNTIQQHLTRKEETEMPTKLKVNSDKLTNLLEQVNENFSLDWLQISGYNLQHRHSPETCEAIWNVYLRPQLKRSEWTIEEKKLLLEVAKNNNFQNWPVISEEMGGKRSDYQCFIQYQTVVCYMRPNRVQKWSKPQDERLLNVVKANTFNGVIKWSVVLAHFPDRNRQTIMHRYNYTLNPQYNRGRFTPEEDLLLLAAVEEYKGEFRNFPRSLFPNRSLEQLRSHYQHCLLKRTKLEPWTLEDDEQLLEFVSKNGEAAWSKCAELLTNHSRSGCRNRYIVIQRHFKKNPNLRLEDIPRRKRGAGYTSTVTAENWIEKIEELRQNPNAIFKLQPQQKPTVKRKNQKLKQCYKKGRVSTKKAKLSNITPLRANEKCKNYTSSSDTELNETNEELDKLTQTDTTLTKYKPKTLYYQKLRTQEYRIYQYFKFSYNFRFDGTTFNNWPNNQKNLGLVTQALGLQLPNGTQTLLNDERMSTDRRYKSKILFQGAFAQPQTIPCGYHLTPGWSTAMAFRAFCILSAPTYPKGFVPEIIDNNTAVLTFRQRLHTLLFQTTMLSRLDANKIQLTVQQQCRVVNTSRTTKRKTSESDLHNAEKQITKKIHLDDELHTKTEFKLDYDGNGDVEYEVLKGENEGLAVGPELEAYTETDGPIDINKSGYTDECIIKTELEL